MIVFKNYANIIKKQFPIVLIYIAVLMLLLNIMENTTQEKTFTGYEQTKVRVAVFNQDEETTMVKNLIRYLEEYCEVVEIADQWKSKLDALYYRDVYYVVTIPSGFSKYFLEDERVHLEVSCVAKSKEANYVDQALDAYLDYMRLYHSIYPKRTSAQLSYMVNAVMKTSVDVDNGGFSQEDTVKKENVQLNFYFNLLGYILLACIVMVVCTAMTVYRREHINRRHSFAPISPMSLNVQLLLGNLAYSYLFTFLFLAIGIALGNERNLSIRTMLYWMNTFAYATSIIFFAYFLAYRMKNKTMINMIANTVGIVLAVISGVFIRQEYLSEKLIQIASVTPVYWYVRGNDSILRMTNFGVEQMLPLGAFIGIQILFAAAFFSLVLVGTKLDETRK